MRVLAACLAGVWALWGGAAAGADLGQTLYETARTAYWRLQEDGPESRAPEAWRRIAEGFGSVAARAPRSPRADDGLYMAGICRERAFALSNALPDRAAALEAYDRLAARYPRSNLADDALLRGGRLLESGGDADGARRYYRRLLDEQAQGDMAALARRRLARVGRPTRVERVRFWSGENYTRVVMDLAHPGPFRAQSLPENPTAGKPRRIYVDFPDAAVSPACQACSPVADGLVTQVRTGQFDPTTARVVLDLEGPATFRVFPLDSPPRVVLDVFREGKTKPDVVGAILAGSTPRDRSARTGAAPEIRIVIDPGHGGKDPGAVGPGGLLEKDVTLTLARELAAILSRRPHWKVKLTRTDDRYLALEERTAIANAFGADLFLSIHTNANRSPRARGVETYYLDRSSDRAARKVAALENASGEAALDEIEHILADVVLTSKVEDSRRLARVVQTALVSGLRRHYGGVRDLGVKKGPFYVLTGAVMPAVLVETSFITHPEEARRLRDAEYRRRAAVALAAGVQRFAEGS
ncbi:MAG: hypothetical protein Kow0092_09420 [Deferrisomatales bacterium]